jgi:hypothetical protein
MKCRPRLEGDISQPMVAPDACNEDKTGVVEEEEVDRL